MTVTNFSFDFRQRSDLSSLTITSLFFENWVMSPKFHQEN